MADHTIAADQYGAYEFHVAAGTTVSVLVTGYGFVRYQVIHHGGSAPIYVSEAPSTAMASDSRIVMPGGWLDLTNGSIYTHDRTVYLTSASDCTASVTRL